MLNYASNLKKPRLNERTDFNMKLKKMHNEMCGTTACSMSAMTLQKKKKKICTEGVGQWTVTVFTMSAPHFI